MSRKQIIRALHEGTAAPGADECGEQARKLARIAWIMATLAALRSAQKRADEAWARVIGNAPPPTAGAPGSEASGGWPDPAAGGTHAPAWEGEGCEEDKEDEGEDPSPSPALAGDGDQPKAGGVTPSEPNSSPALAGEGDRSKSGGGAPFSPPEQAELDSLHDQIKAVLDHDRWPKSLYFGGI